MRQFAVCDIPIWGAYRCKYSVIFGRSEEVTVQNVPIGVLAGVSIASYFGE